MASVETDTTDVPGKDIAEKDVEMVESKADDVSTLDTPVDGSGDNKNDTAKSGSKVNGESNDLEECLTNDKTKSAQNAAPSPEKEPLDESGEGDLVIADESQDEASPALQTTPKSRFDAEPNDREMDLPKLPEGSDDFEISSPTKSVSASKPKAKAKRRSLPTQHVPDSMKEMWKKPFEIGWGREIVYRNTSVDGGKRTGDVYYFSPEGRKLRSMVQIEKHVKDTKSDIPIDCFTFRKEPVFKEPFEIIRSAKEAKTPGFNVKKKNADGSPGGSPTTKPAKQKLNIKLSGLAHMGDRKINATKLIKHDMATDEPLPTNTLGTIQVVGAATQQVIRPKVGVAKKHTGKRKPTILHVNGSEKRQKVLEGNHSMGKQKLCDFTCGKAPPSVSCEVCLCLFHPHCVGHMPGSTPAFVCKGCRSSDDGKVISITPQPTGIIRNMGAAKSAGWPTTNIIFPDITSARPASTGLVSSQLPKGSIALPRQNNTTSLVIGRGMGGAAGVNAITTTRTVQIPVPVAAASPASPPPIRLSIPSGAVSPNQVSGQLITLPAHVTNKLNLAKPLNLKLNGQTFNIPPNCFIATAEGVKVLLPPGSLPEGVAKGATGSRNPLAMGTSNSEGSQQLNIQQMGSGNKSKSASKDKVVDLTEDSGNSNSNDKKTNSGDSNSSVSGKGNSSKKSGGRKIKETMNSKLCHFNKLHAGYDCMIHLFHYLNIPELMRVQQVCRTWHSVASSKCLWRNLRLRNLRVTDWDSAASHISAHHVQTLDLRGMIHPNSDANRTWHQFHSVLAKLKNLRQIEFCQCPSSVLHAVTEELHELKVCTAEFIIETTQDPMAHNAKLDLGKFSELKKLECLKLRGVQGLVLPAFSFSGGLVELANLTALQTLALTTLRDLSAVEFLFLGSLINLEVLEIGDCCLWQDETFAQLGNLKKLRSMRLEAGGNLNNESLGKSLLQIKGLKHLELINFVISRHLSESVAQMDWLENLSVWPNTDKQAANVNSNLLSATKELSTLKIIEWGVMKDTGNGAENETDGIPLLPETPSEDKEKENDPEKPQAAAAKSSGDDNKNVVVTINELIQRLSNHLPDTKIRVFKVPAALIKKFCPPRKQQLQHEEMDDSADADMEEAADVADFQQPVEMDDAVEAVEADVAEPAAAVDAAGTESVEGDVGDKDGDKDENVGDKEGEGGDKEGDDGDKEGDDGDKEGDDGDKEGDDEDKEGEDVDKEGGDGDKEVDGGEKEEEENNTEKASVEGVMETE